MSNKVWHVDGNNWNYIDDVTDSIVKRMENAVYKLVMEPVTERLYLQYMYQSFELPTKMYGLEKKFVSRFITSYKNTEGNIGALLNGLKGTGKSVTAMDICNQLGLPVVMIPKHFKETANYLSTFQQDFVVFIDEYEKIYDNKNSDSLLSLMDGALKGNSRKVFLLTTNEMSVNTYLLQRPGRIRYVKKFTDMTREVIEEILDDTLIYPEFKNDCVEVISKMSIITIDLVKSVVSEVNIHNESPKEFIDIFNIKPPSDTDNYYDLYELSKDRKESLWKSNVRIDFDIPFSERIIGRILSDRLSGIGRIIDFKGDNILKIDVRGYDDLPYDDDDELIIPEGYNPIKVVRIKKPNFVHSSYNNTVNDYLSFM